MKKERNELLFYCYDKNLYEKLYLNEHIPSLLTARHIKTNKQFWVFERTEELTLIVDKYKNYEL